jgi:acyl dehydratase
MMNGNTNALEKTTTSSSSSTSIVSYTSKDLILYGLGIGAGAGAGAGDINHNDNDNNDGDVTTGDDDGDEDDTEELKYVYEHHPHFQAFPTFPLVLHTSHNGELLPFPHQGLQETTKQVCIKAEALVLLLLLPEQQRQRQPHCHLNGSSSNTNKVNVNVNVDATTTTTTKMSEHELQLLQRKLESCPILHIGQTLHNFHPLPVSVSVPVSNNSCNQNSCQGCKCKCCCYDPRFFVTVRQSVMNVKPNAKVGLFVTTRTEYRWRGHDHDHGHDNHCNDNNNDRPRSIISGVTNEPTNNNNCPMHFERDTLLSVATSTILYKGFSSSIVVTSNKSAMKKKKKHVANSNSNSNSTITQAFTFTKTNENAPPPILRQNDNLRSLSSNTNHMMMMSIPAYSQVIRLPPHQALLYRLSGDYNRIHVDGVAGMNMNWNRGQDNNNNTTDGTTTVNTNTKAVPILHGLCTMACGVRAVLQYWRRKLLKSSSSNSNSSIHTHMPDERRDGLQNNNAAAAAAAAAAAGTRHTTTTSNIFVTSVSCQFTKPLRVGSDVRVVVVDADVDETPKTKTKTRRCCSTRNTIMNNEAAAATAKRSVSCTAYFRVEDRRTGEIVLNHGKVEGMILRRLPVQPVNPAAKL